MRTRQLLVPALLIGVIVSMAMQGGRPEVVYTDDFRIPAGEVFLSDGVNPYFPMEPGRVLRYEGEDDGMPIEMQVTVLDELKPVLFQNHDGHWIVALTRVIEEREWTNGELSEISRNYFARAASSNDIYYFGEDVEIYQNGEVVDDKGAWLAGQDGAMPGLFMPGVFLVGSRYCQEVAPGRAMDRAENVAMGLTVVTPAGTFTDCVKVIETTPIEPGEENENVYAPGVGPVTDASLQLVEIIEP